MWIGTVDGLNKFDKNTNNFTHFPYIMDDSTKQNFDVIFCLYKDLKGNFWVGGKGLRTFNKNLGTFKPYLQEFDDLFIFSICEDTSGVMWLGTSYGIIRIDSFSEGKLDYSHFPINKEKPKEKLNNSASIYFESKNDILWVSANKMLYHFDRSKNGFDNSFILEQ